MLAALVLWVGVGSDFLPCSLECAEAYEAHVGALNLLRFGPTHASGLQDLAASPEPTAHPTVYTHNPNLAVYFLYALSLAGVTDLHVQSALTLGPFLAGVVYAYLFLRRALRDPWLTLLCLGHAAVMYLLVALWAFNALRAFSWLLVFAPAYHLHAAGRTSRWRAWHRGAGILFLALSPGVDYTLALFNAGHLVLLSALRVLRTSPIRTAGLVGATLGGVFVLRQLQVASALGPAFVLGDLQHTIARRVGLIGRLSLVTVPSDDELSAWYAAHHVLLWPVDDTSFDPIGWTVTLSRAYGVALGLPPVVMAALFLVVVGFAAAVLLAPKREVVTIVRRAGRGPVMCCRLLVAATVAQVPLFLFLGEYYSHFYGHLLMPLPVHAVVPFLGLLTFLCLGAAAAWGRRTGSHAAASGILALIVVWRLATELGNALALPPSGYPGREVLRRLEGHSVATLWVSSAPSAYTRQWAASLNDLRWRLITSEDVPFEPRRDYAFFFEADVDNPRYRKPDFLLLPAVNTRWLQKRRCEPFAGAIGTRADGCDDPAAMADGVIGLSLYARGSDFLLYDLRDRALTAGLGD